MKNINENKQRIKKKQGRYLLRANDHLRFSSISSSYQQLLRYPFRVWPFSMSSLPLLTKFAEETSAIVGAEWRNREGRKIQRRRERLMEKKGRKVGYLKKRIMILIWKWREREKERETKSDWTKALAMETVRKVISKRKEKKILLDFRKVSETNVRDFLRMIWSRGSIFFLVCSVCDIKEFRDNEEQSSVKFGKDSNFGTKNTQLMKLWRTQWVIWMKEANWSVFLVSGRG